MTESTTKYRGNQQYYVPSLYQQTSPYGCLKWCCISSNDYETNIQTRIHWLWATAVMEKKVRWSRWPTKAGGRKSHTWHNLQIYPRQEIVSHTCLTWKRKTKGEEEEEQRLISQKEVQNKIWEECWQKSVAGACRRKLKGKEESDDLPVEDRSGKLYTIIFLYIGLLHAWLR